MAVYRFNPSAEGRRKEREAGYITIHKQREDKPTRFTKAFQFESKGSTHEISPRALMELSNPNTIYLLGGTPTYVHSRQAYFDAGLSTVNKQLTIMLNNLVAEQKSKIKIYATQINNRWYEKVKSMGIDIEGKLNNTNGFEIFNEFYKQAIMSGETMNEYHAKLLLIQKLRTAVDLTGDIERLRIDAIKQPRTAEQTIMDIIKGQLEILGLNIKKEDIQLELYSTGSAKKFKDKEKLLEKIKEQILINYKQACVDVAKTYGKKLKENARSMVKILGDALTTKVQTQGKSALNEAWTVSFKLLKQKIGDLFELMMQSAINKAFIVETKGTKWEPLFDQIVIEDVVKAYEKDGGTTSTTKNDGSDHKLTSKEAKIDTMLTIKILGNSFDIPISDKTGQKLIASDIIAKDSQSRNYLKVQEHFSAAINLQGNQYAQGIFGDQQASSEVFTADQDAFGRYVNYVLYNEYYLQSTVPSQIKYFNNTLMSYIGWLRLIISIIGVPEKAGEETPMAIRTPRELYNTAQILTDFLQMEPTGITKNLGTGHVSNVTKHVADLQHLLDKVTNKDEIKKIKESLPGFKSSFNIYKNVKSKIISENGGPNDALTYSQLYEMLGEELSKLTSKPVVPMFSTYFNIQLGNMSAII